MRILLAAVLFVVAGCLGSEIVGERDETVPPECMESPPGCFGADRIPELEPFPEAAFDPPDLPCDSVQILEGVPEGPELELRCAEVRVDIPAGGVVEIRGAVLEHVRLSVTGEEGATLRITDSTVEDLSVATAEHAWVELGPGTVAEGLLFDAAPDMDGRVLTLVEAELRGFALRTRGRGELRVEGALLEDGVIDVAELVTAEGQATRVRVRAPRAVVASTAFFDSQLELDAGRMVGSSLTGSEVHGCGSLRLVGSRLQTSFVAACASPLVLAGTTVEDSLVHGTVEASRATTRQSRFWPGPDGSLLFTDSSSVFTSFCETRQFVAWSGTLVCVACQPAIPDAVVEHTYVNAPECPSLEAAADGFSLP